MLKYVEQKNMSEFLGGFEVYEIFDFIIARTVWSLSRCVRVNVRVCVNVRKTILINFRKCVCVYFWNRGGSRAAPKNSENAFRNDF